MDDAIFSRKRGAFRSLLTAIFFSLLMLLADSWWPLMAQVRLQLDRMLSPVYSLMSLPAIMSDWFYDASLSRRNLQRDNGLLRAEMLVLQGRLQKYAAVVAENERLRTLMNAHVAVDGRVLVCEIIGLDPDAQRRIVYVNKGIQDGVYVGQPVLDARGIMGQVLRVGEHHARIMLLADPLASVPVEVNRNGVRGVVTGEGALDRLSVRYIPPSADVRPGDMLVTSGLGLLYPFGYPVAEVVRVNRKSGGDFAEIQARPVAELDRSSHVLLLFGRQLSGGQ